MLFSGFENLSAINGARPATKQYITGLGLHTGGDIVIIDEITSDTTFRSGRWTMYMGIDGFITHGEAELGFNRTSEMLCLFEKYAKNDTLYYLGEKYTLDYKDGFSTLHVR